MTSKKVFDNPDLLRHIYSFGDPSHRAFTKNLQWDLKAYPELFEERYIERKLKECISYSIHDYLYEFSIDNIEDYLQQYKRCFCCKRHTTNKPIWVRGNNHSLGKAIHPGQSVFENQEDTECNCYCRTLTRHFIRHLEYSAFYTPSRI